MRRRLIGCWLSVFLLAGCGGLSGEPEIVATVAPAQLQKSAESSGDWRPNIDNGAAIFAERCVDCHGSKGEGRGELVLAGSIKAPLDMTDRVLVADASPLAWYKIITEGRIEELMPPWRDALSEQERWDVALYAYTLSYDDALLSDGEALWQENCGECALPLVVAPIFSDSEYGKVLNSYSFASRLDEQEIAAAVAYARMESLQQLGKDEETSGAAVPRGNFSGRVEHGSSGGTVPDTMVVQLRFGNAEQGYKQAETTLDADNRFVFADVPLTNEFNYMVSFVYDERVFSRRLLAGHPSDDAYDQTITLYDQTSDPFVITVASIDIFVSPVKLDDLGSGLLITQIITYRNGSDRLYTSGRGFDDGREASLLLQFPAGARVMSGDENGRFVLIEDLEAVPDSLIDTLPVLPGDDHEIIVEYFLPYVDAVYFEQVFNNLLDAGVSVALPSTLSINSEILQPVDGSEVTDNMRTYAGMLKQDIEPRLSFVISGDPYATSSDDNSLITSDTLLPLLLGMGAVGTALLAGLALLRRRQGNRSGTIERLVRQIAQLDEAQKRGQINHDVYHQRRRAFKDKLAALMDYSDGKS